MEKNALKLVYLTPSLYIAGGVERVLTLKANYFAEHFDYDITIILTDGKDRPNAYPLSPKIKVINLDIGFEELWNQPFWKKAILYLKKQAQYKQRLTDVLMRLRPDITDSLLRREINFICDIPDGSRKIGELHVNKNNYRNFEANESNWLKELFARWWMHSLIGKLRRLDRFVVLTHEDKAAWDKDLNNVVAIHNPVSFEPAQPAALSSKRALAVGRYVYQKGFDLLLQAWSQIEKRVPDWTLDVFGQGDTQPYEQLIDELGIDRKRCHLNGPTEHIRDEYAASSLFVVSSRFEGLSMALIEAMSFGLPVVSFACPCGPRDVIEHGVDGILVEKENTDELARRIMEVMEHPELARRLAAAALQKAGQFRIEVLAQQWKTLFENL